MFWNWLTKRPSKSKIIRFNLDLKPDITAYELALILTSVSSFSADAILDGPIGMFEDQEAKIRQGLGGAIRHFVKIDE